MSRRESSNRRNVGTVDSEEMAPLWAGTAGVRLAFDRWSRCCTASKRGDKRAAQMAASGGCTCSSLIQHALLERMIVEGAFGSKASWILLVEASCAAGEGDEAAGRTAAEALSEGCKKSATVELRCGFGIDG